MSDLGRLLEEKVSEALEEAGLYHPKLTGYLGGLLARFVHVDAFKVEDPFSGKQYRDVGSLYSAVEHDHFRAPFVFLVCRGGGELAFGQATVLCPSSGRNSAELRMAELCASGRYFYHIAGTAPEGTHEMPSNLLKNLADEFGDITQIVRLKTSKLLSRAA